MTHRELIIWWLILGLELLLCTLVYVRRVRWRMPFFAGYVTVLAGSTLSMMVVYRYVAYRSAAYYYSAWISVGVGVIALGLAIAEICRYGLRAYRGVWALTWRLLSVLAMIFVGHAALDAWGQPAWFATYILTIDADIEISAIVVLTALFLIRNYYGLIFETQQQWIAAGIFFFCAVDVVNNTMLRNFFANAMLSWSQMKPQVEEANEWWNTIRFSAFIVSLSTWCFALRNPLPAPAEDPVLLPAEVYVELSPAVNLRLRAFNARLLDLLKP
jgi:hypothetical protein